MTGKKRAAPIVLTMLLMLSAITAQGSIVEIITGGGTFADLRESFVEFRECQENSPIQQCYKVLWDPPEFITEGTLTVDIEPLDGDINRIGDVQSITFFHGYTGEGEFRRINMVDKVRFEVPFVSSEAPPDNLDRLDIVQLLIEDTGVGTSVVDFTFDGNDLLVDPRDGGDLVLAQVIPHTETVAHTIPLDTFQEVPPPNLDSLFVDPDDVGGVDLPIGSATVNVDQSSGQVDISGEYRGLTSNAVAAHLHGLAGPGDTAPPIIDLTVSGGTQGTFGGSGILSPENLDGLLRGLTYLNVHTEINGPGEIRGQIIPEPASMTLIAMGFILCVLQRRRCR